MGFLDKLRGKQAANAGQAIDPVCGMSVDTAKPAGRSSHGGQTYYFCSAGCQKQFDQDPHAYLPGHTHG